MIQQSPTEERARLIRYATEAADRAEKHHNTEGVWLFAKQWRVVADALASQASQPAAVDGWVMVPSKIVAGLPHLSVGPSLSEEYWFGWTNAMQAARNHIGQHAVYLAATPKAPTSTAGEVAWRAGRDAAILQVIDYARKVPHLVHPLFVPAVEGIAATLLPGPEFATPPAPNDDLRAALERIVHGPWPEGIDSPERQAQFDDAVARQALGLEPNPHYAPFPALKENRRG